MRPDGRMYTEWTAQDREAVRGDLGREPRGVLGVAARRWDGHPLVVATPPRLPDGSPFPTTFYLTDTELVGACSRLEAEHFMEVLSERLATEPGLRAAYEEAHRDYLNRREQIRQQAGVEPAPEIADFSAGGMPTRVKCLHALIGHSLAAGPGVNPIGDAALEAIKARGLAPIAFEPRRERVAAIDCGTNSIRLLIADVQRDLISTQLQDVERDMVITRLGQGVDRTGRLDPVAISRTLAVAGDYEKRIRASGATKLRIAATSATRDAANSAEFVEGMKEVVGVAPEVISGKEEARLSFVGALSSLPDTLRGPFLVVDIGGGSTEFVLGNKSVEQSVSMDMGSVRVSERFGPEPWDEARLSAARNWIDQRIDEAAESVSLSSVRTVVGVAGTVTTLAGWVFKVPKYQPEVTHGSAPSASEWAEALDFFITEPVEVKQQVPAMPPGRADVIAGGALIWERILLRLGVLDTGAPEGSSKAGHCEGNNLEAAVTAASVPAVVVSEHDILDGLALSL